MVDPSRVSFLTATRARLVLLWLLAMLFAGLWQAKAPVPTRTSPHGGDVFRFRVVVDRMRTGEGYYDAMRIELLRRGYPTASVFNWRPPATFLLLAKAPRISHALMVSLAALALLLTVIIFRNAPPLITIVAIVMQIGFSAIPAIPMDGLFMPELWAGMFLLLSILTHTLGAFRLAVCFAVAAVCARELALPFVLMGLGFAAQARRWDQVRWYAWGLAVFVAYYLAHIVLAVSHIEPGDMLHKGSWIAFGGWRFVVRTVAMGGWFLMLPGWVAAVGVVVVLAALWGPADRHLKAMIAVYLSAFCIVGQTFNTYWGLMTGPAWGLATVYGLIGLHTLIHASLGRRNDLLDAGEGSGQRPSPPAV